MTHGLLVVLSFVLGMMIAVLATGLLLWGQNFNLGVVIRAVRLFLLGDKR